MMRRQAMYVDKERKSYEEYRATHRCRLDEQAESLRT
jgi:hypothetical protein